MKLKFHLPKFAELNNLNQILWDPVEINHIYSHAVDIDCEVAVAVLFCQYLTVRC